MESEIDVMLREVLEVFGAEQMLNGITVMLATLCKVNNKAIAATIVLDGEPFTVAATPGDHYGVMT